LNPEFIELFKNADWPMIKPKLAAYALMKVRLLHWNTAFGSLPEGKTPEDIVHEAIQSTLRGLLTDATGDGLRKWNPAKDPDLLLYLKDVVDSMVNNLVTLKEHKVNNYSADVSQDVAANILQTSIDNNEHKDALAQRSSPEDVVIKGQIAKLEQERYTNLKAVLYKVFEDKDDELLVIMAMEEIAESDDEITPTTILDKTGLNKEQIKNIRKRIKRRLDTNHDQIIMMKGKAK